MVPSKTKRFTSVVKIEFQTIKLFIETQKNRAPLFFLVGRIALTDAILFHVKKHIQKLHRKSLRFIYILIRTRSFHNSTTAHTHSSPVNQSHHVLAYLQSTRTYQNTRPLIVDTEHQERKKRTSTDDEQSVYNEMLYLPLAPCVWHGKHKKFGSCICYRVLLLLIKNTFVFVRVPVVLCSCTREKWKNSGDNSSFRSLSTFGIRCFFSRGQKILSNK